jgi:NitT/TauT family transport system substrate-binding protein
MKLLTRGNLLLALILIPILVISACQPAAPASTAAPQEPVKLKFAPMAILDSLPMFVAQKQGYFTKYSLDVEIIPVSSAPERDQLFAAAQVDGVINEVLTSILADKEEARYQVVRYARVATADSALFRILASKDSGITTPAGLKDVEIGISNATVIEYLTDRLLQAEGLTPDEIKKIAVPGIPDRMALLSSGELKAGVLPDPLASLAMLQGAANVVDDTRHPEYSFSTIAFRKEYLDQHPDAVKAFLKAIEEAVADINKSPDQWKSVLIEQKILPQPLQESFKVPAFVTSGVPSQEQYQDIHQWAVDKGLLTAEVPYDRVVNPAFLTAK